MKKRNIGIYLFFYTFIYGLYYLLDPFTKAEEAGTSTIYEKIAKSDHINYLIIGDSIGRGSGAETQAKAWFSKVENLLKKEYHINAKRRSIVQSGATAFEGLYKLQDTKHFGNIDLTFIVFGENDRKYMTSDEFAYFYEELIRETKSIYPDTEIITLTESSLDYEDFAQAISDISAHYGAKNIDMRKAFKESGFSEADLTTDMVHPNGKGYQIYAEKIFAIIAQNMKQQTVIASLAPPLHENKRIVMIKQHDFIEKQGFTQLKNGYFHSKRPGDSIEYQFSGTYLGVNVLRSENGGHLDVFIDGEFIRTLPTWWPFERERNLYITSGLSDDFHHVKFVVSDKFPTNSSIRDRHIQLSSIIAQEE